MIDECRIEIKTVHSVNIESVLDFNNPYAIFISMRLNFSDNLTAVEKRIDVCVYIRKYIYRHYWDTWESCVKQTIWRDMKHQTAINASIFFHYNIVALVIIATAAPEKYPIKTYKRPIEMLMRRRMQTVRVFFIDPIIQIERKSEKRERESEKDDLPQNTMT